MDLVAVHGFTPAGVPHSRTPQKVWEDRFNAAWERASRLQSEYGLKTDEILVWIFGGKTDTERKSEAAYMKEYGEQTRHPLLEEFTVAVEEESEDTATNVKAAYRIAREHNVAAIHPVSSKDHISRVHREYLFHDDATEFDILPKGSERTYVESGDKPFIIEMGPYRELARGLESSVWDVPLSARERAGEQINEVLEAFQSREGLSKVNLRGSSQ